MQLLALIIYSANGAHRVVDFKPGALNVVTGQSATGKSTLLDIFEYCTGRKTVTFPVGPMTDAISWYAALFQLSKTRAFVARPAPGPGKTPTNQVMLKFGPGLEPLTFDNLAANTDSRTLRQSLGRMIGIEENRSLGNHDNTLGTEAHLGHATLLCLQGQSEIADRSRLFHRQSDRHVASALKQTLPYFLGAAPHDQARKHAQLSTARKRLKQAENSLTQAQRASDTAQTTLAALWHEAHALSLLPSPFPPEDHVRALASLHDAVLARPELPNAAQGDVRVLELEQSSRGLRDQLRALAVDRRLLLAENDAANDYADAVRIPRGRLASIGLIQLPEDEETTCCVLCGSRLTEPDPTVETLRRSLHRLNRQLEGIDAIHPAMRTALQDIEQRTAELRRQLSAAEQALQALVVDREAAGGDSPTEIDFARGRIHGMLTALQSESPADPARLRQARDTARSAVQALEVELDPETERDQLLDRLVPISRDITMWASDLQLEHGYKGAHLNLSRLTVEFDDDQRQFPLSAMGSAQNWIGYHVLSHLALHRYFVRQRRPVPRILFLDQPTQAWFPSTGSDNERSNEDHLASERLLKLIHEVTQELAPKLQVIICDHVNLSPSWFREAVVHDWRNGEKLVPTEWV